MLLLYCEYTTYNVDQWLYRKLLVCTIILWAGVGVGVQYRAADTLYVGLKSCDLCFVSSLCGTSPRCHFFPGAIFFPPLASTLHPSHNIHRRTLLPSLATSRNDHQQLHFIHHRLCSQCLLRVCRAQGGTTKLAQRQHKSR